MWPRSSGEYDSAWEGWELRVKNRDKAFPEVSPSLRFTSASGQCDNHWPNMHWVYLSWNLPSRQTWILEHKTNATN